MNSSISSSESVDAGGGWRRWLAAYFAALVGAFLVLQILVVVVDPYSTGRLTPFRDIDVAISMRTHANAGRVRDMTFDSVILGNSISTRIRPDLLDAATGRRFVQLSIPGMGPANELVFARAFLRAHGSQARTILLPLEQRWCETDERQVLRYPQFPFWLYEGNTLDYLAHILSIDSLQAAFHRLGMKMGLVGGAARQDGYVPRDQRGEWRPDRMAKFIDLKRPSDGPLPSSVYPDFNLLETFVRELDPGVQLVMVFMPYYISAMPVPGSNAAAWLDGCKARARQIASLRPRTVVIDRMLDDAISRDPTNFWDPSHVRDDIIRNIEVDIASAIQRLD